MTNHKDIDRMEYLGRKVAVHPSRDGWILKIDRKSQVGRFPTPVRAHMRAIEIIKAETIPMKSDFKNYRLTLQITDCSQVTRSALQRRAYEDHLSIEEWCSEVVLGMLQSHEDSLTFPSGPYAELEEVKAS